MERSCSPSTGHLPGRAGDEFTVRILLVEQLPRAQSCGRAISLGAGRGVSSSRRVIDRCGGSRATIERIFAMASARYQRANDMRWEYFS
jgi:hypothetical protein